MEPEVIEESEGRRLLTLLMADEKLSGFSIEDYIDAIRESVEDDLKSYLDGAEDGEQPHPLVVSCLEACINHLGDASMAYYASLK